MTYKQYSLNRAHCEHRGRWTMGRRQGQALLLAVLIMVFAALLASTFITVVAINLNQTSRQEDRADATAAAAAGLSVVNQQLVSSDKGENWRPEQLSPPPAPTDASYDTYYTSLDKAQGWARTVPAVSGSDSVPSDIAAYGPSGTSYPASLTGVGGDWNQDGTYDSVTDDWAKLEYYKNKTGNRVFTKSPDPRQENSFGAHTPTYLTEVTKLNSTNGSTDGSDKYDMLRITVVGLSQDNPNVYVTRVGYKPTSKNQGPFYYARYDSNYDVTNNKPVTSTLTAAPNTPTLGNLTVQDATGFIPGRTIIVQSGTTTVYCLIKSISSNILTVNTSTFTGISSGATVRAASILTENLLGGSSGNDFDADADNSTTGAWDTTLAQTHTAVNRGAKVNGGLVVEKKVTLGLKTGGQTAYFDIVGPLVGGTTTDACVVDTASPTPTPIASSSLVRTYTSEQTSDPTQQNSSIGPLAAPSLDASRSRYLTLTRDSDIINGSAYGFGNGVYIDNVDDTEKVAQTSANSYRPLNLTDMHRLWQRKSFVAQSGDASSNFTNSSGAAHKLAWASPSPAPTYTYPVTGGNRSLEQQGLRGWVSPWEFKPRGVLIDLQGQTIVITRDDRSDTVSPITSPDSAKRWHKTDGTTIHGGYRMELDTSTGTRKICAPGAAAVYQPGTTVTFNGVIFAEGNVRIRGYLDSTTAKDLTIVSMGNIYVEGSVNRTSAAPHIALLAKQNVVLNPTQFIPHIEGSVDTDIADYITTNVVINTASTGSTLDISDVTLFRVGDLLRVGKTQATSQKLVRVISITRPSTAVSGTLQLDASVTAATTDKIYPLTDPALAADTTTNERFYKAAPNGLLARNVRFDNGTVYSDYRFAIRHSGEQETAFTLTPNVLTVTRTATVKPDSNSDGKISSTEKTIALGTNPTLDLLNLTGSTGDPNNRLSDLKTKVESTYIPLTTTPTWAMSIASADLQNLAARRIPVISTTVTSSLKVPVTVSGDLFWMSNLDLSTATPFRSFGSSSYANPSADENSPGGSNSLGTLSLSFYQDATTQNQAATNWYNTALTGTPAATGTNYLTLRTEDDSNWNAANKPATGTLLPNYRIGGLKVERGTFANGTFTPGMDIQINATIYAQNGSWFVIPMPALNKAPAVTDATSTRYRRLNYAITVTGTIAQNFTPSGDVDGDNEQDPDGYTNGAMRRWMDSLSYPSTVSGGYGTSWKSIQYLEYPSTDTTYDPSKLQLPVSSSLLYVS